MTLSAPMNTEMLETRPTEKAEVEVTLFWGKAFDKNVLTTKHIPLGTSVRIGEEPGCDFPIPMDAIGTSALEVLSFRGGETVVTPPANSFVFVDRLPRAASPFVLAFGHAVEIEVGAFSMLFQASVALPKIPIALGTKLEQAGLGHIGLSAVVHASLLAAFAFFMPSLGQADEEGIDRDQMLMMKAFVTSAAERELETPPPVVSEGAGSGSASDSGQRAAHEEGAMGGPKPVTTPGRWSAAGDTPRENATLARERALADARDSALVGILNSSTFADPNAPVVPWGTVLAGADRASHLGNLWSDSIGDATGTGLGLSGVGSGGGCTGGDCEGIGLAHGVLGHDGLGQCTGANCNGHGFGTGPMGGAHIPHPPRIRMPTDVATNGHLDPAIIQRIVRMNSGRMLACYQAGLRTNPSLSGRVSVGFVIGRDGDVTMSKDSPGSDLADTNVRQCVVKSFYSISFPKPEAGIVTVTYPLTFSPAD